MLQPWFHVGAARSCSKLLNLSIKSINTQPDSAICQVCKPEDAEDLLEIAAEQVEGEDA